MMSFDLLYAAALGYREAVQRAACAGCVHCSFAWEVMDGKGDEEGGRELERGEGNLVVATSSPYNKFSLGICCAWLIHCWYEFIVLV